MNHFVQRLYIQSEGKGGGKEKGGKVGGREREGRAGGKGGELEGRMRGRRMSVY
jgi:hypothetical protein